jgi:hypothetical protein
MTWSRAFPEPFVDEIGSAVAADFERMGPHKLAEMNSGLLDEYLAAQRSRH